MIDLARAARNAKAAADRARPLRVVALIRSEMPSNLATITTSHRLVEHPMSKLYPGRTALETTVEIECASVRRVGEAPPVGPITWQEARRRGEARVRAGRGLPMWPAPKKTASKVRPKKVRGERVNAGGSPWWRARFADRVERGLPKSRAAERRERRKAKGRPA